MIKRISSQKSGRSYKTLSKMDSFSINDSSIESQNQTKKLRKKETYKEIYLDKMGISSSISVRKKNLSLLTKSLNDSDDRVIFRSSRNSSSGNNNNDSKRYKKVSSSFLSSLKENLSIKKGNKKISNSSHKRKTPKRKTINPNNKNKNKVNKNEKIINIDDDEEEINNIKDKEVSLDNINQYINNNNNQTNKNNNNKNDKLHVKNISLIQKESEKNIQKDKLNLDDVNFENSPNQKKGILKIPYSDNLKRKSKKSKTVNFGENVIEHHHGIKKSKTLKQEKIINGKENNEIEELMTKIYKKMGFTGMELIKDLNNKTLDNNELSNDIIFNDNDNEKEENIKEENIIKKIKRDSLLLKENKKRKSSSNYGNIIFTDEKGNIINQNEGNNNNKEIKILESENLNLNLNNDNLNKDNIIKTESNESINNSINENKKFDDDLEERIILFEEINNKKEKKVDTIKEEDEEYESDFLSSNKKKKSGNNLNENLKKSSNNHNVNKVLNNKKRIIEQQFIIEKIDFEIGRKNNEDIKNRYIETQSDMVNQKSSKSSFLSSSDKKTLDNNIEIKYPNLMIKKNENKIKSIHEVEKITDFIRKIRNENNKKLLSITQKDNKTIDKNGTFNYNKDYNEKRKKKIDNIKNILTEKINEINKVEKNYNKKKKRFSNLVKLTNSVSSIRLISKDLNHFKNKSNSIINFKKQIIYNFPNKSRNEGIKLLYSNQNNKYSNCDNNTYDQFTNNNNNDKMYELEIIKANSIYNKVHSDFIAFQNNLFNVNKNEKTIPRIKSYIDVPKYIPFQRGYIMPVNQMDDVITAKTNYLYGNN